MPRPKQCRRVSYSPDCTYFKPAGIPTSTLEEVVVAVDELEALRLADVEGLYHEKAANQMGVSRRTFGRIIDSARKKVAQALIQGMALRIEGGVVEMAEQRSFRCGDCEHEWQLPFGTGRPTGCPKCQSRNYRRAEEERRQRGRQRRGRGSQGEASTDSESTAQKGRGRRRQGRRRGASA